ncbi:MAG: hypothetical protein QOD86_1567 [Miltoncostaeaceae bacterium]|nr:hypothetical protein [Miltoncostaeaceae bacterium]
MARTVGEEVFERVQALTAAPSALGRTEAIRRVAEEMGRTPSATSSAFYAAARRAGGPGGGPQGGLEAERDAPGRSSGHSDAGRLYAEMLPLVEAGGSIEQAARRFGSEDDVPAIAAGFRRWRSRQQGDASAAAPRRRHEDPEARIVALEAENRGLRNELARTRRTLARIRTLADEAAE